MVWLENKMFKYVSILEVYKSAKLVETADILAANKLLPDYQCRETALE